MSLKFFLDYVILINWHTFSFHWPILSSSVTESITGQLYWAFGA